jgi:hypothetical protein
VYAARDVCTRTGFFGFLYAADATPAVAPPAALPPLLLGLNPVVKTPLTSVDFINQRGTANFVNTALLSPGQTFGNNGFAYQTPYQNRNVYHGRW